MSDYILFIFTIRVTLLPTLYQRYTPSLKHSPLRYRPPHSKQLSNYVDNCFTDHPVLCIWLIGAYLQLIHSVVCLTTGPKPLPKRAVHPVPSRASSFKWQYLPLSLRSSSRFLCLLPRLPVTYIPPFVFPSITCCKRQFLRKMSLIQLAFRLLISYRILFITVLFLFLLKNVLTTYKSTPSFTCS